VENYFRKNESVAAVRRAFRTRIKSPGPQGVSDRKSIILGVKNFRETGSVVRNGSGRSQTTRRAENIDAVMQSVLKSVCQRASEFFCISS